jgi:hypothetical protein
MATPPLLLTTVPGATVRVTPAGMRRPVVSLTASSEGSVPLTVTVPVVENPWTPPPLAVSPVKRFTLSADPPTVNAGELVEVDWVTVLFWTVGVEP